MDIDTQIANTMGNLNAAFGQVEHLQKQKRIWSKISKKHPDSKSLKGVLGHIESRLRDAKFDIKDARFNLKSTKILKSWIEL